MYKRLLFLIALLTILLLPTSAWAFKSNSTNYKLDGDFGNFGGSKSSTNYNLTDTGGGFAIGFGSSANYGSGSGFQYLLAEIPEISFIISASSINLNTLSAGSVSTDSHTISVTTNAAQGYVVRVYQDGNLCRIALPCNGNNDIDPVSPSPGTISAGVEGYGLATSKSGQQIVQDTSCGSAAYNASAVTTSPQSVASSSLPITGDSATMCYAASISNTTAAGSYIQTVTYIATGTF